MKFIKELNQLNEGRMKEIYTELRDIFTETADDYKAQSPEAFENISEDNLAFEIKEIVWDFPKFQELLDRYGFPRDWLDTPEGDQVISDWAYDYVRGVAESVRKHKGTTKTVTEGKVKEFYMDIEDHIKRVAEDYWHPSWKEDLEYAASEIEDLLKQDRAFLKMLQSYGFSVNDRMIQDELYNIVYEWVLDRGR